MLRKNCLAHVRAAIVRPRFILVAEQLHPRGAEVKQEAAENLDKNFHKETDEFILKEDHNFLILPLCPYLYQNLNQKKSQPSLLRW